MHGIFASMKSLLTVLLFLFCTPATRAQTLNKYWVEFTDKHNTPYCTCRPYEFLSARALDRRARSGIPVVENDLPVNPWYLDSLTRDGALIHHTSRWLNAATVIADSATAGRLRRHAFIKSAQYVGPDISIRNPPNRPPKTRTPFPDYPRAGAGDFGYSGRQNAMLGTPLLYWAGARGQNIWVAVMDGGFTNADKMPFFDSIAIHGRLFQGRDFVERDDAVYESAMHGTSVLSVMAGNLPGYFIGTAPEATYFLLKTEDTGGEFPVEECNWVAGAEWADSTGVDIINASLGYTVFNDTTLGHRYWELDGRSSIGARGAAIAAGKGMIICNSAGNSGEDTWRLIGVPSDAPGVIAVGACDYENSRAAFSSIGPTADGRIKPDLMAPGEMVVTAGNRGVELGLSSGTSLAAPLLSGSIASLWSAFPQKSDREIIDAVYRAADQENSPDFYRGYGLPDLSLAWLRLGGFYHAGPNRADDGTFFSFDRQAGCLTFLHLNHLPETNRLVEVRDITGKRVCSLPARVYSGDISRLELSTAGDLPAGVYRISFQTGEACYSWSVFIGK
jgi:serine protease AprX